MSKYISTPKRSRLKTLLEKVTKFVKNPQKIILIFIILVVTNIILKFNLSKIEEIRCVSQYGVCNKELEDGLKAYTGKYTFKTKIEVKKYLEKSGYNNFQIKYIFPNIIETVVVEKKALYAIKSVDNYFLIDKDGNVLAVSDTTSLPYVTTNYILPTDLKVIDESHIFALTILSYLNYIYMINNGEINENGILFVHPEGFKIYYPKDGNAKELIGATRLIINKILAKDKDFDLEKAYNQITIDLRYTKPIVR